MVWCHTFLGNLGTGARAKRVSVPRFPRMIYVTNKTTVKPEEFNKEVCVWSHNLPKHYSPKFGLNWMDCIHYYKIMLPVDFCDHHHLHLKATRFGTKQSQFFLENWLLILCHIKSKKGLFFALPDRMTCNNYYSTQKPVMNTMTKGPNINLGQFKLELLMR